MLGKSFDEHSPLFLQIKARIEDQIMSGALSEDEQVPSTTQIVQFYKINHITVAKGVNLLVDEGILYKKRGVGIFVSKGAKNMLIEKRKERFLTQYLKPMLAEAKKLSIEITALIGMMEQE
ncbi:MAG: GntR family transcriptional regulator [Defluviitaleaceae bacterium]|nr:GntR family transcriptional regulator [Defluviitaleaceae bacterium]